MKTSGITGQNLWTFIRGISYKKNLMCHLPTQAHGCISRQPVGKFPGLQDPQEPLKTSNSLVLYLTSLNEVKYKTGHLFKVMDPISIFVFIHFLSTTLFLSRVVGGRERGGVHPGKVASQTQSWEVETNQPFTLMFSPTGNLDSPLNLSAYFWSVGGRARSQSTHRELKHFSVFRLFIHHFSNGVICHYTVCN